MKEKFYSTKTYNNDRGLSCCFRQWRSTHSHCRFLHGYSIGVKLVFSCESLDERNWVYDFGGLRKFKEWLDYMFDHTILVAEDDPNIEEFKRMAQYEGDDKMVDLRIVPAVGCERFAQMAYDEMYKLIQESKKDGSILNSTVHIDSVEVFEHGANSAIYSKK